MDDRIRHPTAEEIKRLTFIDNFPVTDNSPANFHWIAMLLLLVALTFRIANLDKFDPLYDENITLGVVNNILHGDLRNNWKFADVPGTFRIDFYNFSSYFYADAAFVQLADTITDVRPAHAVHWHRIGSVIAGTLGIFLFYLLALKWFDRKTALILLAFLAVAPILVQDAHYARPEAFELLLVGVVYLLSTKLHEGVFRYSVLACACACVGFLGATKLTLLPMLAVVLFWVPQDLLRDRATALRIALISAGMTALGMFAGVPNAFFHPAGYWNGIEVLRKEYSGVLRPHGNLSGGNTLNLELIYFWQTLGPVLLILAGVAAITLFRAKRKLIWASLCLPVAFYFAAFSTQGTFFERNLSHVVPLMLALSAAGLITVVENVRGRKIPGWMPPLLAMVLFMGAMIPPAMVSSKLVFVAMVTNTETRAKSYEENLLNQSGRSVDEIVAGMKDEQMAHLADLVREKGSGGVLVRVVEYNDPFTEHNVAELARHVEVQQIGFYPSVFANLRASTLQAHHSPALRYLLLSRLPGAEVTGWRFLRLGDALHQIEPGHIEVGSWEANGFYPEVGLPVGGGRYFGSWTKKQGDKNVGIFRMGPLEVEEGVRLGIPIVTGPVTQGLSISVKDHHTGADLAGMNPTPVLAKWKLWEVELPKNGKLSVDIVAIDQGSDFGQWMAIGTPRAVDESFFRLGEELLDGSATIAIQGAWTKDGYYPDAGRPPVEGAVYGSWSGNDANVGSLHLGPIRVKGQNAIGIPLVTGPGDKGLSIKVLNSMTGKAIASLNPLPVHTAWWVWNVVLSPPDTSIEIVAQDAGTGYGQWMAIGQPHTVR